MKLDLKAAEKWFASQKWEAAAFQEAAWQAYAEGKKRDCKRTHRKW